MGRKGCAFPKRTNGGLKKAPQSPYSIQRRAKIPRRKKNWWSWHKRKSEFVAHVCVPPLSKEKNRPRPRGSPNLSKAGKGNGMKWDGFHPRPLKTPKGDMILYGGVWMGQKGLDSFGRPPMEGVLTPGTFRKILGSLGFKKKG